MAQGGKGQEIFQFNSAIAVTPDDARNLNAQNINGNYAVLYIGTTGDLNVILPGSTNAVLFKSVAVGWFPGQVVQVKATSTTASNIVACFNTP